MQTLDIQIEEVNMQLRKLQEVKAFLQRTQGVTGQNPLSREPKITIHKYWQEY